MNGQRQPCELCGARAEQPSAIILRYPTRFAWNQLTLCRKHALEWVALGRVKFSERYPKVEYLLLRLGWEFDEVRLWHPEMRVINPLADDL